MESVGEEIGYFIGSVFAFAIMGAIVGLLPFFLARRRGLNSLGLVLILAVAGGGLLYEWIGIIAALAISLVIVWYQVRQQKN